MDKTSKKILNYMISLGGCEKSFLFSEDIRNMAVAFGTSTENLRANIRFLHENEYIDYQEDSRSHRAIAFSLSHKGLHWKYFRRQEIIRYLEDKWIDFLAMLMSLASIILSIIAIGN